MRESPMIREARATGRGHGWALELAIFLAVFTAATAVEELPLALGMGGWLLSEPAVLSPAVSALARGGLSALGDAVARIMGQMPDWLNLLTLFCTGLMTAAVLLFCRWIEKRGAATLGLRRGHVLREYAAGALAGLVMVSAAVGLGVATGAFAVLPAARVRPWLIALYMLGYMVQGMSEEVLCRGYFMISLARKNPVWLSVVVSSLIFAALHLANPGMNWLAFVNIALSGAVFAVYVLKRGDLWGACALHSFWNFFQGHLYGVSVSGMGQHPGASFLQTEATGVTLLAGGSFGLEAGLCDTAVELIALLVLLFVVPYARDTRI